MRTVQMTLDEDLVKEVDFVAGKLHTNRSAFTRNALQQAIQGYYARCKEKQHQKGYEKHPVEKEEFSCWEDEQEWGDW